jgi:hypothetical protein
LRLATEVRRLKDSLILLPKVYMERQMNESEVCYMRVDDFFASNESTTIAQEVQEKLTQQGGFDVIQHQLQENWSVMANKIVGAEG